MMNEDSNMTHSELHFVDYSKRSSWSLRRVLIGAMVVAVLALVIGVLIGYFGRGSSCDGVCLGSDVPSKIIEDADPSVQQKIVDGISADNIKENLRKFTMYPHLGGTENEHRMAQEIHDIWKNQGMDNVEMVTYEVLLSYPDESDPSTIQLINGTGDIMFQCQIREKNLTADQDAGDIVLPFNSYSPPGDVQGQLVYVNYATVEDFEELHNKSVNLIGAIAIARYGQIFRGDKVNLAAQNGLSAIILYTDPADYSIDGVDPYPHSWWLPDTGVQRGTVFTGDGDPLTPGYPAVESAYRYSEDNITLPTIPVHPISFGDAKQLMQHMDGAEAPEDWQGAMNITYRIGPGFVNDMWVVKMHITTSNRRANTSNVIGYIEGSVEPDRYVILGNHRDAWVFGAVDPTSGTAAMMELSRVFMDIVNDGWRPRRSIMFCSWGAEEYGLVGSYEWVENFVKNLGERTVAYLNVDMTFEGNHTMRARGVPILYDLLYDVAHQIKSPNNPSLTMYEEWFRAFPDNDRDKPVIRGLGAGSDYAAFMNFAGIPAVDVRYTYDNRWTIGDYPVYHSAYETFYLVENFIDPDFQYSKAITTFWGELARRLSDMLLLPLSVVTYTEALHLYVEELEMGYGNLMEKNNIALDGLAKAVVHFEAAAKSFDDAITRINKRNPIEVRQYNDQLMHLERAFLDPAGLPLRPLYKHLLFAPSQHNSYAGTSFPGLVDLMFEIEGADDEAAKWEQVRRHLATLIFTIESAASTLKPPTKFA